MQGSPEAVLLRNSGHVCTRGNTATLLSTPMTASYLEDPRAAGGSTRHSSSRQWGSGWATGARSRRCGPPSLARKERPPQRLELRATCLWPGLTLRRVRGTTFCKCIERPSRCVPPPPPGPRFLPLPELTASQGEGDSTAQQILGHRLLGPWPDCRGCHPLFQVDSNVGPGPRDLDVWAFLRVGRSPRWRQCQASDCTARQPLSRCRHYEAGEGLATRACAAAPQETWHGHGTGDWAVSPSVSAAWRYRTRKQRQVGKLASQTASKLAPFRQE